MSERIDEEILKYRKIQQTLSVTLVASALTFFLFSILNLMSLGIFCVILVNIVLLAMLIFQGMLLFCMGYIEGLKKVEDLLGVDE